MAGDWIKIEHPTPDKPEVIRMANGAFSVATANITIDGQNDVATISGDAARTITEENYAATQAGATQPNAPASGKSS